MKGSYRCSFLLHRREVGDSSRLVCRVRWAGSRSAVDMAVGFVVDPENWDARAQRCVRGSLHGRAKIPAAAINREISRWEETVDGVFAEMDGWPTVDRLRTRLRAALGLETAPAEKSLPEAMAEFIAEGRQGSDWSPAVVAKFRTLLSQLEEWRPGVEFGDLDRAGLLSFCGHLRDGLGLLNSTAAKKLGQLRWFLRWAAGRGYLGCRDYEDFRPGLKQAQNRVVFLTWDELMRVWDYAPPASAPCLGQVRDIFCFCAFTSCRYSDAEALRWADVFERSFFIVSQKTDDPLEIDLNKWSREILERYRGREYPEGRVFPRIANQVANRALKRIARECGIAAPVRRTVYDASGRRDEIRPKWELVGTHTARRTFICNALMMGIPPNVVMKWTGHSSYNAMRPYIDVADGARREAMEGFDRLHK